MQEEVRLQTFEHSKSEKGEPAKDVGQITTPAPLVDLDAVEFNLQGMGDFCANKKCKQRLDFQNLAARLSVWKQLRVGAIGVPCVRLRKAKILVDHGVDNIRIAHEFSWRRKI